MSDIGDLVAWLRGVLDEDERIARALDGEGWNAHDKDVHGMRRVTVNYSTETVVACTLAVRGEHIATHDPAAVLADVAAKQALLRQFELRGNSTRAVVQPSTGGVWDDLLRMLAGAYAGRPGYREEWRP